MKSTRTGLALAIWLVAALEVGAMVPPAPHTLVAGRLDLRDHRDRPERRRVLLIAKDGDVTVPAAGTPDDPTLAGGWVHLWNPTTGDEDIALLPAGGWKGLGKPAGSRGWRYRDERGDAGPCTSVVVRAGKRVTVRCRGAGIDLTLDEAEQGAVTVQVGFGNMARYCAATGELYGGTVRRDVSTIDKRRARYDASVVAPVDGCPVAPTVLVAGPGNADGEVGAQAGFIRGREPQAPILAGMTAVNTHTLFDAEARDQYNAGVLPLVVASGATVVTIASGGTVVQNAGAPSEWAQGELEAPFYPSGLAFLEFSSQPEFRTLGSLKERQVGGTLHFVFQACLWDCAMLEGRPFFPPVAGGRLLVFQAGASRETIETNASLLGAEADGSPDVTLAWVGRSVADFFILDVDGIVRPPFADPLSADATLIYEVSETADLTAVLALPELAAFLAAADAWVASEYRG